MSNPNNIHDYRILVTGACGFLGRRLVEMLLSRGAAVIGIDSRRPSSDTFVEIPSRSPFRFIHGSFEKRGNEIASELKGRHREKTAVFHMAGLVNVDECRKNPAKAFESNISLTFRVLEFSRNYGIRKFVFPSTGLVYGDRSKRPVTEKDATFPQNIYVATKLSAEAGVEGYSRTFGFSSIVARLGNVYGPNSRPDTVIGTILQQIRKGKKVAVRDPWAVRDFIHVDDVIEGLVRLFISTDEEPGCHMVNLSTGVGSSVKKVMDILCTAGPFPSTRILPPKGRKGVSKLILKNSLLVKVTGWKPQYTLREGLLLTLKNDPSYACR